MRLDAELSADYEDILANFNDAIDTLERTVSAVAETVTAVHSNSRRNDRGLK